MNNDFRRKSFLSQNLKQLIKERLSYCIQFEQGTKLTKDLTLNTISQSDTKLLGELCWLRQRKKIRTNCISGVQKKISNKHLLQMTFLAEMVEIGFVCNNPTVLTKTCQFFRVLQTQKTFSKSVYLFYVTFTESLYTRSSIGNQIIFRNSGEILSFELIEFCLEMLNREFA